MAFNIHEEQTLTVRQALDVVAQLRGGEAIHLATLYRWMKRGVRGVRLESVRLGGSRITSREAIQRFASGLAALDESCSVTPRPDEARIQRVERELDRHGL